MVRVRRRTEATDVVEHRQLVGTALQVPVHVAHRTFTVSLVVRRRVGAPHAVSVVRAPVAGRADATAARLSCRLALRDVVALP